MLHKTHEKREDIGGIIGLADVGKSIQLEEPVQILLVVGHVQLNMKHK